MYKPKVGVEIIVIKNLGGKRYVMLHKRKGELKRIIGVAAEDTQN